MWREFLKIADADGLKENEFNYKCIEFGESPNKLGELVHLGIKKVAISLIFLYET